MIAPPAGTYAYVATVNGQPSGKTSVTVARNPDGTTTITENGSGTIQGIAGTAQATLALGADLSPVSYTSHVDAGGMALDSGATFAGTVATTTGGLGGPQTIPLVGAKHFVVLDGGLLGGFIALPAQIAAWPGEPVLGIAPVYGRSTSVDVDASAKPVRPANVPAGDASLSFNAQVGIVEWYDPATMVVDEIDVPSQGLIASRSR